MEPELGPTDISVPSDLTPGAELGDEPRRCDPGARSHHATHTALEMTQKHLIRQQVRIKAT